MLIFSDIQSELVDGVSLKEYFEYSPVKSLERQSKHNQVEVKIKNAISGYFNSFISIPSKKLSWDKENQSLEQYIDEAVYPLNCPCPIEFKNLDDILGICTNSYISQIISQHIKFLSSPLKFKQALTVFSLIRMLANQDITMQYFSGSSDTNLPTFHFDNIQLQEFLGVNLSDRFEYHPSPTQTQLAHFNQVNRLKKEAVCLYLRSFYTEEQLLGFNPTNFSYLSSCLKPSDLPSSISCISPLLHIMASTKDCNITSELMALYERILNTFDIPLGLFLIAQFGMIANYDIYLRTDI